MEVFEHARTHEETDPVLEACATARPKKLEEKKVKKIYVSFLITVFVPLPLDLRIRPYRVFNL